MDVSQLAGAFGSVVEPAATVAARNAAAQQLGDFGVDPSLNPFIPAPAAPVRPVGASASLAKEDQQRPASLVDRAMAWVKQYQRLILIVGGVAVVAGLVLRRKKKK